MPGLAAPNTLQAFRLGRYTIHWHMHGDVAFGSWLKGVAIHHTYNRAATIHGTHRVLTQNCVSYDTMVGGCGALLMIKVLKCWVGVVYAWNAVYY